MAKGRDWSKARKPRETESIRGGDLMPGSPKRLPIPKADLRKKADRAYAEWLHRNGAKR